MEFKVIVQYANEVDHVRLSADSERQLVLMLNDIYQAEDLVYTIVEEFPGPYGVKEDVTPVVCPF